MIAMFIESRKEKEMFNKISVQWFRMVQLKKTILWPLETTVQMKRTPILMKKLEGSAVGFAKPSDYKSPLQLGETLT